MAGVEEGPVVAVGVLVGVLVGKTVAGAGVTVGAEVPVAVGPGVDGAAVAAGEPVLSARRPWVELDVGTTAVAAPEELLGTDVAITGGGVAGTAKTVRFSCSAMAS